jgi:PAS domain S-box-containing protein
MATLGGAGSLAIAYFLAARLGLDLLSAPSDVAAFWPASGMAAGILITSGRRASPALVIGVVVGTVAANLTSDRNFWTSIFKGFCNAGEAVLVAWLLERWFGRAFTFGALHRVVGFLAAAGLATATSAIGGAATMTVFHTPTPFSDAWRTWFLSDGIGIVVVAPLVIGLGQVWRQPPSQREVIEGVGVLALLALIVMYFVTYPTESWLWFSPGIVVLPLLLWLAARCPPAFAIAGAFIVSILVICATIYGRGRFGDASIPIIERVKGAQAAVTTVTVFSLLMAALFDQRKQAEVSLRRSEAKLAGILAIAGDAIVSIDAEHRITLFNEAAVRMFGYAQSEVLGQTIDLLIPHRFHLAHRRHIEHFASGPDIARRMGERQEVVGRRKNGDEFPTEASISKLDVGGERYYTVVLRDVTERKRAEMHQSLLISELDHRVKNMLARVAVVVMFTGEGRSTKEELLQALDGRIQALAHAHALLSQSRWKGVGLSEVVRHQLAPYVSVANTTTGGPEVALTAAAAEAIAMVLYELVTNAAKYGALSTPQGHIAITWNRGAGGTSPASAIIEWREIGGPPVTAPTRSSYGTNLVRDLIPHELGGTVDLAFAADGVRCRIELPAEQLEE